MSYREDTIVGRVQRRIDVRRHGDVSFTSFGAGGWSRTHADGFARDFFKRPLEPTYDCPQCGRGGRRSRERVCYQCAGDNRLTDRQRVYMRTLREEQDRRDDHQPAHCDGNVLHAPGKCWACDLPKYAGAHALRDALAIAHSDEPVPRGWDPCPSTAWRPAAKINRWGGNRAEAS